MNPIDMAVRSILAERLTGVAYPNSALYGWYVEYCLRRDIAPASRTRLGKAMKRFGAVNFLTNSHIGRCWYIPTPQERRDGIPTRLGTAQVLRS